MTQKILIALRSFAEKDLAPLRKLEQAKTILVFNKLGRQLGAEDILNLAKSCDGIIAGDEKYTAEILKQLPQLKCISRCGVGLDSIDLEYARQAGIKICNTPDLVAAPVAELVLGMILNLYKKLTFHTNHLKQKKWERAWGQMLTGKKIGVYGLGRIGKAVALLLKKMDTQILAFDQMPDQKWCQEQGVKLVSQTELLKEADILTIHVSSNLDSKPLLSTAEFSLMKKNAVLINTSRGSSIDEAALYQALKSDLLGGAALDVFAKEPYSGPLLDLENTLVTPHIGTFTVESRIAMENQAVEHLLGFFKEKSL